MIQSTRSVFVGSFGQTHDEHASRCSRQEHLSACHHHCSSHDDDRRAPLRCGRISNEASPKMFQAALRTTASRRIVRRHVLMDSSRTLSSLRLPEMRQRRRATLTLWDHSTQFYSGSPRLNQQNRILFSRGNQRASVTHQKRWFSSEQKSTAPKEEPQGRLQSRMRFLGSGDLAPVYGVVLVVLAVVVGPYVVMYVDCVSPSLSLLFRSHLV